MTKWCEASKASARAKQRLRRDIAPDRHLTMASLYREGLSLQQIGDQYGMTRERVRQILKYECGMTRSEGGIFERSRQRKLAKIEARHRYSKTILCALRKLGRELMLGGMHRDRTPLGAFRRQRTNAKTRGIEWRLTLTQWWEIWQRSGHWDERGRGHAYAMCRYGDKGPYAVNNVYIATNSQNIKHYYARTRIEAAA